MLLECFAFHLFSLLPTNLKISKSKFGKPKVMTTQHHTSS